MNTTPIPGGKDAIFGRPGAKADTVGVRVSVEIWQKNEPGNETREQFDARYKKGGNEPPHGRNFTYGKPTPSGDVSVQSLLQYCVD